MKIAVRYYSRSGNTKAVADAIAAAANTEAVSVDRADAAISEPVDILFIGGAVYFHGIDGHMKSYLKTLKAGDAAKAVVFSTSKASRHGLEVISKALEKAGIPAEAETFYVKSKPDSAQLEEAAAFAKKFF